MTKYTLLRSHSVNNLEESVNELLEKGWELHGHTNSLVKRQQYQYRGTGIDNIQSAIQYTQAMITRPIPILWSEKEDI